MVSLINLPPEIVHSILSFVDPEDLGTIPQTCHALNDFIKGNRALCRDIYHRTLDEPPSPDINWEQELHDLVRLKHICSNQAPDKKSHLPFVLSTVTHLLTNASSEGHRPLPDSHSPRDHLIHLSLTYPPSRNVTLLSTIFHSEETREAFLCRSFLFSRARGETKRFEDPPLEEHQQSAKLHSLYGMPLLKYGRTRSSRLYPFACSKVYDLRQYTQESGWGPFLNDGSWRVDWEKVEAILLIMKSNIRSKGLDRFPVFEHMWNVPFAGTWQGSWMPWGGACKKKEKERDDDPYEITGTWIRVVCFLDYNDFFNYNFPLGNWQIPENVPRPLLDVGEATRLITLRIGVTEVNPPGPEDHQDYPVVSFTGISRAFDGSWDDSADSDIRGTVRMTPEGEVRWTSYSVFDGEERWKSEGVQVGGVRSARGVVGNWFEKNYDPHGPCGPTAYWKISDVGPGEKEEIDQHDVLFHDFRYAAHQYSLNLNHDSDDSDGESGSFESLDYEDYLRQFALLRDGDDEEDDEDWYEEGEEEEYEQGGGGEEDGDGEGDDDDDETELTEEQDIGSWNRSISLLSGYSALRHGQGVCECHGHGGGDDESD